MKTAISILVIFLILGPAKSSVSNNPVFHSGNDTSQCIRTVQWGSIQICLPMIQGMTECFSHPAIIAKNAKTETKEDESFAFYLNNETHKRIDSLEKINYDNYFKIYSLKGIKNEPADQSALNQLDEMVQKNSFRVSWDSIKQNTIKNSNRITIGQPALIDHYSPNENIRSFILLVKFNIADYGDYLGIFTTNFILIKNRIIIVAYFKSFDGEESLEKAKSMNDYITLRVLQANL